MVFDSLRGRVPASALVGVAVVGVLLALLELLGRAGEALEGSYHDHNRPV